MSIFHGALTSILAYPPSYAHNEAVRKGFESILTWKTIAVITYWTIQVH